jgi:hypothetical protein
MDGMFAPPFCDAAMAFNTCIACSGAISPALIACKILFVISFAPAGGGGRPVCPFAPGGGGGRNPGGGGGTMFCEKAVAGGAVGTPLV